MIPFDQVPAELRLYERPQWVCWRREIRANKPTKVPYDAKTGSLAATNQPATWGTFEEACARTDMDGIGFVLTGTKYVGIDFDGVIAETGEPEPFVLEILGLLANPYTETTPSGRGLRAFVVAPLPPGRRRFTREGYGAEIYTGSEAGRYLTMTGAKISGNGIPRLENISLSYFLLSQIVDSKFKKLWMGDIADYGDDSRADLALMGMLARALQGNRQNMESAFSASRLGQRKKWTRADYRKRTIDKALEGQNAPVPELLPATLSDTGNAELALESIGKHSLYCKEQKRWYLANQTERWSPDRTNRIAELVQRLMQARWAELAKKPDVKDPRLRHALRSLDRHAIADCVSILEFQQTIAAVPENLDSDPLLLGVMNGILNLATGELVPPRLDLLVTKCAPVRFDPAARCDLFLEYLEQVQPKEEVRKFLQRLAGSLLTGLQPEQCIIFFFGVGANGKSVFIRVFTDVLGPDYCFKARKQLLFISGRRSLEHGANDVADLEGKRLISSTEQVGKQWNWEFLKDYSGGELQHGRQLYRVAGNFKPTGKIIVSANQEPILAEFDEAVRRRFVCLPWPVIVPEAQRVAPLEFYVSSLLRDGGASGVLNWASEGLRDLIGRNWRLDPPQAAVDATRDYIRSEDRVRRFFQDWFEDGPTADELTTKDLRKYFAAWLDEDQKFVMSPHSFTKECRRIFGERCHIKRSNWHSVDDLRLSAHGQEEYNEHIKRQKEREKNLFSKAESKE